jgi:hypothetical protein
LTPGLSAAADYTIEAVAEAPAPDGLAETIAKQLSPGGLKVMRGTRTYCEIWVAQDVQVAADFTPSDTVLYPFGVGQLIGAIRLKSKGQDFRGQEIKTGVYTLRYGQQPVDGNHVGTSPTRDFLLLVPAADDQSLDPIAQEDLFKESAEAAQSAHPAILSLLPPGDAAGELPALVHREEDDVWSARFVVKDSAAGKAGKLILNLVIAGHAKE